MSTNPLLWLVEAVGSMFDPVADLVYDQGVDGSYGFLPGYGSLLDPQTVDPSDIQYLAQFVGVQVPAGADQATALSLVLAEQGQHRGTLASLGAAIQRNLTGTQYVEVIERLGPDGTTPNAYWMNIFVKPTEVISTPALNAAISAALPGGVFYTLTESAGPTWSQGTKQWQNVAGTVTWANVQTGQV